MSEAKITLELTIYALTPTSTVDRPEYKQSTYHVVDFLASDFDTLTSLTDAIARKTNAGFLRSQFFRMCLASEFPGGFITTTQALQEKRHVIFAQPSQRHLSLIRYTKQQCQQLKGKVTNEELLILDHVLRFKRKYNRMPMSSSACPPATSFEIVDAGPDGSNHVTLASNYKRLDEGSRNQILGCGATILECTVGRPETLQDAILDIRRVAGDANLRPRAYHSYERAAALYKAGILPISKIYRDMANNRPLEETIQRVEFKKKVGIPTVSVEVPVTLLADVYSYIGRKMINADMEDYEPRGGETL